MTKLVYNRCYGGFSLSDAATEMLLNLKNIEFNKSNDNPMLTKYTNKTDDSSLYTFINNISRIDKDLVKVVEELGDKANGLCANLQIKNIPSGTKYRIDDYDGYETVKIGYGSYEWETMI